MSSENRPNLPSKLPLISTLPEFVVFPNNTLELQVSMSPGLKTAIQTSGYITIALPVKTEKHQTVLPEYTYGAVAEINSISEYDTDYNSYLVKFTGLFPVKITETENVLAQSSELPYTLAGWEKIEIMPLEENLWLDPKFQNKLTSLKNMVHSHLDGLDEMAAEFSLRETGLTKLRADAELALAEVTKDNLCQVLDKIAMILNSNLRSRIKAIYSDIREQAKEFYGKKLQGFSLPPLSNHLLMMLGEPSLGIRVSLLLALSKPKKQYGI